MADAVLWKKQSNQSYEDEHLGFWPIYVLKCGPAVWLVRSDVNDKYRYVCDNKNIPRLYRISPKLRP